MAAITLAEEFPFAAVANDPSSICSNCFRYFPPNQKLKRCQGCRTLHYCSVQCQKDDFTFHKEECKLLAKFSECPSRLTRLVCRVILRVKKGNLAKSFRGSTFDDIPDNLDKYELAPDPDNPKCPINEMKKTYQELIKFMGAKNVPPTATVFSYVGKCIKMLVQLGQENSGIGVFVGLSGHTPSCRADCFIALNGKKLMLRSFDRNLTYSKDLTVDYYCAWLPRALRRVDMGIFKCNCERCLDDEQDFFESAGRSTCCPLEGAILPKNDGSPPVCCRCKKESPLTYQKIHWANGTIEKRFVDYRRGTMTPTSVEQDTRLFELCHKILATSNLYLLFFAIHLLDQYGARTDFYDTWKRLARYAERVTKEVCCESQEYLYRRKRMVDIEMYSIEYKLVAKQPVTFNNQMVALFKTTYLYGKRIVGDETDFTNRIRVFFLWYMWQSTDNSNINRIIFCQKAAGILMNYMDEVPDEKGEFIVELVDEGVNEEGQQKQVAHLSYLIEPVRGLYERIDEAEQGKEKKSPEDGKKNERFSICLNALDERNEPGEEAADYSKELEEFRRIEAREKYGYLPDEMKTGYDLLRSFASRNFDPVHCLVDRLTRDSAKKTKWTPAVELTLDYITACVFFFSLVLLLTVFVYPLMAIAIQLL